MPRPVAQSLSLQPRDPGSGGGGVEVGGTCKRVSTRARWPKDLGSRTLNFPPNEPEAEPRGRQGTAITMQNRWRVCKVTPGSGRLSHHIPQTPEEGWTFRPDQGWDPLGLQQRTPPSGHLEQPLHLVRTSQGPQSVTLGTASSGSQWFPPHRACPSRDLAKARQYTAPVTWSQEEGSLAGRGA